MNNSHVRVGSAVRVRAQRWRVAAIRAAGDAHRIVTLAGTGPFNAGDTLEVVTPFDRIDSFPATRTLRLVAQSRWRRAWHDLLCEHAVCGTPAALRTAASAQIDLLPHQLEPAIAVLRGLGSRLLIADDVGLGKTIESALIVAELRARAAADRVLVLAPAGVREQWMHELKARFGLDAAVMDTREGRRRAATLPAGVNPWSTLQVAISSIDYVKRPEVLGAVASVRWDIVIVDEAHGVTLGSDRHRAADAICKRAAYVLLLTATPHNGEERAFESLCALGTVQDDPLIVFRRRREEVGIGPRRRIHRLHIRPSPEERSMFEALGALTRAVLAQPDLASDARLALAVLEKRGLSSAHSLAETARRRLAASADEGGNRVYQPSLPLDIAADDLEGDAAPDWCGPLLRDESQERRLLQRVLENASSAVARQGKIAAVRRLLRRLSALGERAVVFTEYRDTLLHLHERLNRPAALIHGGMSAEERRAAVEAFTRGTATLLLATDAAGEGLNLHAACRVVINLELPWNPMRLEQRIGRVDRIGQTRQVHVFHLIARDGGEIALLAKLHGRLASANAQVAVDNPLGACATSDERVPAVAGVRLAGEAHDEHARLSALRTRRARAHASNTPCTPFSGHDVLATRARGRVRVALAGRAVAIVRTSLEDSLGSPVAIRSIALLAAIEDEAARSLVSAQSFLARIRAVPIDKVDGVAEAWRAAATEVHRAFWRCRAMRERAISTLRGAEPPLQGGLFDRRAERLLAECIGEQQRFASECEHRVAAAERALQLHDTPPEPHLLLLA